MSIQDFILGYTAGSGQGGSDPVLEPLSVTANGNYTPEEGVDGFDTVTVNVPSKEDVSWHQCPNEVKNYLNNVTYDTDYSYSLMPNYHYPELTYTKPIGKTIEGNTYYNNIPNIATPYSAQSKAGTLTAIDRLRWINSVTHNMRDLGGWACDGGTVKYGKIYRSADINSADEELFINELGISVEIDLTADGSPASFDGMEYVCADSYAQKSLT